MKEIQITSGRMNPGIDPVLHAWGWEIPLYLFIGGLVAGILFFAALFYLRNESEKYKAAVKIAPLFAPPLLAIGLFALFLDLSHKLYFWRLYTTIRLESPMSWGAWTLMIVFPLSVLWPLQFIREIFPNLLKDWKLLDDVIALVKKFATVGLGIYFAFGRFGHVHGNPAFRLQCATFLEYVHFGHVVFSFRVFHRNRFHHLIE